MDISFDFINGLVFGVEHIGKNLEEDVTESVIVVSLFLLRVIIWLGDEEE